MNKNLEIKIAEMLAFGFKRENFDIHMSEDGKNTCIEFKRYKDALKYEKYAKIQAQSLGYKFNSNDFTNEDAPLLDWERKCADTIGGVAKDIFNAIDTSNKNKGVNLH